MARLSGIPLVDLFGLSDRINSVLPQTFQDVIDRFVIVEYRATRSPDVIVHHGQLQSILSSVGSDVEELDLGFGKLSIPLVTSGIPFQLSTLRKPISANLEPAADAWQLDLKLDEFILVLDFLEAAVYVPEAGTASRHLIRNAQNKVVRIIGGATVRFEKADADSPVAVKFIGVSDPLDPTSLTGGVASLTFSPPHFFFGSSEFGMTVGRFTYDFSEEFSPPYVIDRGQSAAWMGLAIGEATLYAPRNLPAFGDLSGGVKNVLIGSPTGLQGELEIQFGRAALNPDTFRFVQDGQTTERGASGTGLSRVVDIEASQDEGVGIATAFTASDPPEGGALEDWSARWIWPNGDATTGDTSTGRIRHGQVLRVTPFETVSSQNIFHPEISFRFNASGTAPAIRVTAGALSFDNVVHLNGTAADIDALTLTAVSTAPGTSEFRWQIPSTGAAGEGNTFTFSLAGQAGKHYIVLSETPEGESNARISRVQVKLNESGGLLIGTEGGVFASGDATTSVELTDVEATFDLSDFHGQGVFNVKNEQAELAPATPARVTVPGDGLACVVISEGGAPPVAEYDRHVQILMEYDDNVVRGWGEHKPSNATAAGDESQLHPQLLEWVARYPGAEFLVIGHCDDIGSDTYNNGLADRRAAKAVELLTNEPGGLNPPAAITSGDIAERGEQDLFDPADGVTPDEQTGLGMSADEQAVDRLINLVEDQTGWPSGRDTAHAAEPTRVKYRRADIYALGGTPTDDAIVRTLDPGRAPDLRRSLVPANGRDVAPADSPSPDIDYRVKLVLGWDKPTASGWQDAVPNLAEVEFAWTPAQTPLPDLGGNPVDVSRETLTVYGKWIYDDLTGFTRLTLGVRSDGDPDGLISTQQKQLTTALAFGPMLLSGVDLEDDTVGSAARLTSLAAAIAFAEVDLGGGPLVGDGSKASLIAVEAQAETRTIQDPATAFKIKLLAEYTTLMHLNGGALGLRTHPQQPMKIRYKNVGIEFDNTKPGWERVGFAYDTDSMRIEDPGRWQIDGILGQLLRIIEVAMGNGSLWIEGRIAIAINIGVVQISEAIIRLTFQDDQTLPDFELRGFTVNVDVPGVLKGEGRLRIEDGGTIKAGIEASIIPIGLGASAAIAFAKPPEIDPDVFLNLFLRVQFATPLPLAQSGAAIYGFMGQFVMNGARDVAPGSDVVTRELGWWRKNPEDKYKPQAVQYALGVGVVVGTLPDVSFCFSASGMVVVAFPDPEVILAVDVKIIEVPNTTVTDKGSESGTITGLIVIDDEAVTVAVSAQYEIPKILKLKIPFGAYFPYSLIGTYVRLGSDGVTGTLPDGTPFSRAGEPITLTLLPDTLNLQAWSYLMIEQDGLPSLGGDPRFSFDGFSVGFGAGAGLELSAGPIELRASIKILVGFGTDPLLIKGGIFVDGELDLVVLSISARGEIILTYLDENLFLECEFCGEVDLFFFSIKGCVSFEIGNDVALNIEEPEPPVVSVVLTDRKNTIMGEAAPGTTPIRGEPIFRLQEQNGELVNTGVPPKDNHTVWPDTAPVINFRHYVEDTLGSADQFDPTSSPVGTKWFGSDRLKYAYRLDNVRLVRDRDDIQVEPIDKPQLQSTWTTSPYRQPNASGEAGAPLASDVEGPALKLLDWEPWTWAIPMDDGGDSTNGDPVDTVENLCDPLPLPQRACVFGRTAVGASLLAVKLRQETLAPPPYPSRFCLGGEPVLTAASRRFTGIALSGFINFVGATLRPGQVVNLPAPVPVEGETLNRGYRLPAAERAAAGGLTTTVLPWEGTFDREVTRPYVTLLVCDAAGDAPEKHCHDFGAAGQGGRFTNRVFDAITVRALSDAQPFELTDRVDARGAGARFGSDSRGDILVPPAGIEIFFRTPCRQLELFFIHAQNDAVVVDGVDTNGKPVGPVTVNGPANATNTATLTAPDGIVRVRVKSVDKSLLLYRICCQGEPLPPEQPKPECEDFRRLKPTRRQVPRVRHKGFEIEPLQSGDQLTLRDAVDQTTTPPVPGRDRSAEIHFPDDGIRVKLPKPCRAVEVWVMLFAGPVKIEALDEMDRVVAVDGTPRRQGVAHRLALNGARPIHSLVLRGGSNEAALLRICCADRPVETEACTDFKGAKINDGVRGFEHLGHSFEDISSQQGLRLVDEVTISDGTARPGNDGEPELQFASEGLRIKLPAACDRVVLRVMVFSRAGVKAEAIDQLGARVDVTGAPGGTGVAHELVLEARGITLINLFGGEKAVLYEVCCRQKDEGSTALAPNPVDGKDIPAVLGLVDSERVDTWPGRVVRAGGAGVGEGCHVVIYEPPTNSVGPWDGFLIQTVVGKTVTLLAVCAIDQSAVDAQAEDQDGRETLAQDLTVVATLPVTERREIVLEPGETYRIEVDWSWQAWEANDDGTDQPPATPDSGAWTAAASTQTFNFRVADETIDAASPQDGLNEYLFDARDINRYLNLVEPSDGRSAHFLDDLLWAHFSTGHVQQLAEQYGRMLALEVKRTDPPPQSTPAALQVELAPLAGVLHWAYGPPTLDALVHQRANAAFLDAPCLPDRPVGGGASLGGQFDLEPRAMYDFNVIAPRTDGTNPVLVSGTRFVTSRYRNPTELIESLGFSVGAEAPFAPDEILLPDGAVLPSGVMEISDTLLGDLLITMDADTLSLPTSRARTYVVWRFDTTTAPAGTWQVQGLLLDSLEPLFRDIAVEADGQAKIVTRCQVDTALLGGIGFTVFRATQNWTRVFLLPRAPVVLTPGRHTLSLAFTTSDGPLTATRTIMHVPVILEQEGLA